MSNVKSFNLQTFIAELSVASVRSQPWIGMAILIIFYTIGVVGIGFLGGANFILLTPLNLLLSLAVVLFYQPSWSNAKVWTLLVCYLVGYGMEVIGVNTGVIFGEYQYGPVLGPKIFDTPLMIGVNWVLLVYASGMFIHWLLPKQSFLVQALISASTMVLLDIIIEPVAIHYNFWTWAGPTIPLKNFIAWWIISFGLLLLFHKAFKNEQNKVARTLLFLQFAFFAILNITA